MISAKAYIRKKASIENASRFMGMYSMVNFGIYAVAMLVASFFKPFYGLNLMFIFPIVSALLAWFGMRKICQNQAEGKESQGNFLDFFRFQRRNKVFKKLLKDIRQFGINFYYVCLMFFFL